jgi:hypothetical protein
MSGIFAALTSIATAAATEATARTARKLVWAAVASICLLIGVAFAAAAGYEALAIAYGPLMAKLFIAGAFLIAGLAIFAVMALRKSQQRRQAATSGTTTTVAVAFAMGLLSGLGRRKS